MDDTDADSNTVCDPDTIADTTRAPVHDPQNDQVTEIIKSDPKNTESDPKSARITMFWAKVTSKIKVS